MENQEVCCRNSSGSGIMSQTSLPLVVKWIDDTIHLSLYCNSYISILTLIVISGLIYYTLFTPSNRIWVLGDMGYEHHYSSKSRKTKAEQVNEVRRRKNLGDLPPVNPNGWYALIDSSDIKPGQVKHVQALGENFAVMRTTAGQVHVLQANCPHLGANLAVGGVVRGDCLECPFHGWQFRGEDGVCSHIPYSEKAPKSACAKPWSSSEVNRVIFVWYDAEGRPPSWQVESIPAVENGQWWFAGRAEITFHAHIQDVSENGADIAHFSSVHGDGMQAEGETWTRSSLLRRTLLRHVWKPRWWVSPDPGQEHKCNSSMQLTTKLFDKYQISQATTNYVQVGPALYIIGTYPLTQIITFTPIEPFLIKAVVRCYSSLLYLPASKLLVNFGIHFVLSQDVLIWTHKKYLSQPQLCKEDGNILIHRRWYKQFYSANSPKYSPQQTPLE